MPVRYERAGTVGVITIDSPPVNALGQAVRQGLIEALDRGLTDADARALVLMGAGRTFTGGADIREFGKPLAAPSLHEVIARYESSAKPVVAAIHGTTMGGGFELALGCHYRVAAGNAKLGLPEIKLGLLPGAGGTQRLPRLAGVDTAVEMILSGDPIPAARAMSLGVVDAIIDGDLKDGAVRFASSLGAGPHPKVRDRDEKLAEARAKPDPFAKIRSELARRARGQLAPHRAVDAIALTLTTPFEEALAKERQIFQELVTSPQSKGSIHAFFAERQVAKIPDVPEATPTRPIARAAVIGAGTMGGGIAMCFANAGIPVQVVETTQEALGRGLEVVRKNYAATVAKGRLPQAAMDERMRLIQGSLDMQAVREADIVIEAVFEEMDIKKDVFRALDRLCKPGAILATNTSTLDVDEIAAVTKRPADVIGTHFFSPANVMRLLEVVRGKATAKDVIATTMKLGRRLGKVPVLVGVCDGFVGNRMLARYFKQAEFLVEEGALPQQVDKVLTDFGLPMGLFAMSDMAGNDVTWRIRKRQAASLPPNVRVSKIIDQLCEGGRFGQKTGAGWYRYEKGDRMPLPDPAVEEIIKAESARLGVTRRAISDDEILKRCIYALVNEGANILDEGIALRPGDIDIIYIYGYGFPAWRGGPMFYADQIGLETVYDEVCRFAARDAENWTPAPLLKRLTEQGKSFASLEAR
ncbi:MAG TPA: 3-hydroxyacyl-CoA dehydrogenase NAD-binding domain-containing protein [Alphaproteobacteria bacterium]|nr:3-hydroxyacyl-CoA dehydrogenase NAD-binding domain-containing protein [Alphaproteobacteria bacterium]